MPKEDTAKRTTRRKKETTLREVVVKHVKLSFEFYGLEAAMKEFNDIKVMFSDLTPEWSDIASEVLDFFLEKKRQAQEAAGEREQQINQMWADALAKNGVFAKVGVHVYFNKFSSWKTRRKRESCRSKSTTA